MFCGEVLLKSLGKRQKVYNIREELKIKLRRNEDGNKNRRI